MKKTTKNILIASGVAAATAVCAVAAHRLIANGLMTMAMDRKEPKVMTKGKQKIMGSGELAAVMDKLTVAAADLESRELETVEIEAFDGIKLIGHWYPCEEPKRVIIAMHGWRSSWSQDFGLIADFWHDNDCCVLFAEQRGQGLSGGDYMGFGLLERHDCFEWIRWTHEKIKGSLPIYLGGTSMGAATILMTSNMSLPESVHGIVADSAFTSPHAVWKHVVQKNLHIPYGLYSAIARDTCNKKISMKSDSFSCPEALKECKVPVMLIHGTDDRFVPVTMTYENYKACASEKRLLVVPGADHCLSYLVDKKTYEEAVLRFWEDYDEKIPAHGDE